MPPSTDPTSSSATLPPLTQRLSKMVLSAQFVWFIGHFTTVIQALLYIFGRSGRNYSKAYYGTIISYAIIMYKAHGIPQVNSVYFNRIMRDENTQYFILALIWATSKPLSVTLIPYTVFSFFHSLNYIRSEILPTLLPPSTVSLTPRLQDYVLRFVREYQSKALRFVAYAEVWAILPLLTIGIFFGWSSLIAPIIYARFLLFRYHMSALTKAAVADLRTRLDSLAEHPSLPPTAKRLYEKAREMVIKWGDIEAQARATAAPATQ